MGFNVFLFLAFISCACGFSGPTTSNRFDGYIYTVCDSSSDNVQTNDGCTGCFYKYSRQTQSEEAISLLERCGTTYLGNQYTECAVANNTENTNQVYCDFEKCIARLSGLDLINQCVTEAREVSDADNATFITNVIICILAKHRCRPDPTYTPYPNAPPRPNALFVDINNRLQVIYNVYYDEGTTPCSYGPNGEYIYNPNQNQQPSWPSAQCPAAQTTPVPISTDFPTTSTS